MTAARGCWSVTCRNTGRFTAKGSFRCEFQKYGCAERGTRAELERHCADDAARHLRLVMLQLDAQHEKYARWYAEVDGVKEAVAERVRADDEVVAAVNAEVRRVEDEGKAEIVTLRRGLADLRAYYEEEVGRLQAQLKRVAKDSDARVADLRAENAALRTAAVGQDDPRGARRFRRGRVRVERNARARNGSCQG